jgi:phosphatidylserine/phosphatidylglycerophosphate/cardiolipin synthase-like enzyme
MRLPGASFGLVILAGVLLSSIASATDRLPLDGATAEVCFTPGADCARVVASAMDAARERVWLLGYGFSENTILNALREARRRGLDVRVILDKSNDDGGRNSGAAWMAKNGVPVWIDRSVAIAHNKLILIDRDTVIVGSLNWTKAGNTKNAENVHVLRGARELAKRHEAYFRDREAVSEPYKAPVSGPKTR